jgi:hypothetical protein
VMIGLHFVQTEHFHKTQIKISFLFPHPGHRVPEVYCRFASAYLRVGPLWLHVQTEMNGSLDDLEAGLGLPAALP